NIKSLLLVGFLGYGFPAILFSLAETNINSFLAGILNSLTPLFTLIIGILVYSVKFRKNRLIGVLIGFGGAFALIYKPGVSLFESGSWFAVFIVIATIFYGLQTNEVKHKLSHLDGVTITALSFFVVGPFAGIYLAFSGLDLFNADIFKLTNLGYIGILALFSSVAAMLLYNTLIHYTSAVFIASVTYIIPLFAIIWGIFDGEAFTKFDLIWVLVIFTGIYLVNKK
ncbi:MAG: DMT family transporter, partial [Bacteroidota bacterium]